MKEIYKDEQETEEKKIRGHYFIAWACYKVHIHAISKTPLAVPFLWDDFYFQNLNAIENNADTDI